MAEQMRPSSPQQAPDPADSYERSNPGREAGMGRMDNNTAVPTNSPDRQQQAVGNKQHLPRQLNTHDATNQRGGPAREEGDRSKPDHSMKDEEPMGWDRAPTDIQDPKRQRQPKTEGKGGVN